MFRIWHLLAFGLLGVGAMQSPAVAHENHQQEKVEENTSASRGPAGTPAARHPTASRDEGTQPPAANVVQRFFRWLGRMHPFFVHFPIVLFPVAWLMLIVTQRRAYPVEIVRGLIIVAGLAAIVAMSAGWLNTGLAFADRDPYQLWHRWIGTGLGAAGAVLALSAWRRPASVASRQMVVALGLITFVLLLQGWLGGVVTHGVRHMMF
jgi:uncharacterized membrane protein